MIRPIDTATLGPICERPNLDAAGARIVRETLTPVGYAVESEPEPGSVQIYPEAALIAARPGADV